MLGPRGEPGGFAQRRSAVWPLLRNPDFPAELYCAVRPHLAFSPRL